MNIKYLNFVLLFTVLIYASSCVNTKKSTYFNDVTDINVTPDVSDSNAVILKKGDVLSILVTSLNPEATAIFNATNTTRINYSAGGTDMSYGGYLINREGTIQFPILGNIKAEGLNKKQLIDYITATLIEKKLLIDPIVSIRQLNFEVTVIGEVTRPAVITVPSERLSLLKALGMAGDITIYGTKDNVLLIREQNGKRMVKRIDLNSKEFLTSPYYYLQPNDVVYVESNKNKVASVSRTRQSLPVIISSLSFAAIALQIIFN